MGRFLLVIALSVAPLFAQGPPPGGGPPGGTPFAPPATATVNVDCAAGQKLSDALKTPAGELTVIFTGTCVEDVTIRRSDVTLRGGAPGATIDGSSTAVPNGNALYIDGGLRVTLSDFTIANSDAGGLWMRFATVTATNVAIVDNAFVGVLVDGCTLRLASCTISRNFAGVVASGGNALVGFVDQVIIADNTEYGVYSSDAAYVYTAGTPTTSLTISGSAEGIYLEGNGQFHGSRAVTLRGNRLGIVAVTGSIVDISQIAISEGERGALLVDAYMRLGGTIGGQSVSAIAALRGSNVELYRGRTGTSISGNRIGIEADGLSQVSMSDTSVTGNTERDIRLSFGATLSRYQNVDVGTIACDDTTLIRPATTCVATAARPPAALSFQRRPLIEREPRVRERD